MLGGYCQIYILDSFLNIQCIYFLTSTHWLYYIVFTTRGLFVPFYFKYWVCPLSPTPKITSLIIASIMEWYIIFSCGINFIWCHWWWGLSIRQSQKLKFYLKIAVNFFLNLYNRKDNQLDYHDLPKHNHFSQENMEIWLLHVKNSAHSLNICILWCTQ